MWLVVADDVKVLIPSANAAKYPDLVALCGEPRLLDDRRDVLLNPSLILEVLSDSSEAYDRGEKFALYRQLPSLEEYLLVSQNRVRAELYILGAGGRWTLNGPCPARRRRLPCQHWVHPCAGRGL